jgi:hypothetical protein
MEKKNGNDNVLANSLLYTCHHDEVEGKSSTPDTRRMTRTHDAALRHSGSRRHRCRGWGIRRTFSHQSEKEEWVYKLDRETIEIRGGVPCESLDSH